MSQAVDYELGAAMSGLALRIELNDILDAIATGNVGNDAPATTYPNMVWIEADAARIWRRTNANDGWIDVGPLAAHFDAALEALDQVTPAADRLAYFTSGSAAALATFTSFARTLLDDADAATARATLGAAGLAVANTFTGVQTVDIGAAAGSAIIVTSSEGGASSGPNLVMDRASASPAANDDLAYLFWYGRDSGANSTIYGYQGCRIVDPTNGSEDGEFAWVTVQGGALTTVLRAGLGLQVGNAPTGGDKGYGTINCDTAPGLYVDGNPATRPLLATLTAGNSATLDFTVGDTSKYLGYEVYFEDLIPATDAVLMWVRTSTNGGSSWRTTSYMYHTQNIDMGTPSIAENPGSASASAMVMSRPAVSGIDSAGGRYTGTLVAHCTPNLCYVWCDTTYLDSAGTLRLHEQCGGYSPDGNVNGLRFMFSSGNITSGIIRIYGIPK